ncbi:MAG: molecular chaperone DnaJ, partial [Bacteroidales bacterium]|nr:molecular chaperone DnaJ [Bacteroidales bacterium]
MAEKRDYYEVLGVSKDASLDDIKKAYKKMALKYHPDRHVNDSESEKKEAEEKFKEAAEAYDVLSDSDKKAKYDRFGHAAFDGQAGPDFSHGFGNLDDILSSLFGGAFGGSGFGFDFGGFGGGSQQGPRRTRGRDIRTRVTLTLEEVAKGCTKEVSIERQVCCPDCGGKGAKSEADIKTCPACKGTGQVKRVVNSFFGQAVQMSTCQQCGGEGKIITKPCHSCSGSGFVRKRETIKVNIPAGMNEDMQLTQRGYGHAGKNNAPSGDLLIVFNIADHKDFERNGNHLIYTKVLSIPEAILGTEITVPCFDGPLVQKVAPGTQSGHIEKVRGKGLPSANGYGQGDLYIK